MTLDFAGWLVVGPDGRIARVDTDLCQLLGWTPGALRAGAFEAVLAGDPEAARKERERILDEAPGTQTRALLRDAEGGHHDVALWVSSGPGAGDDRQVMLIVRSRESVESAWALALLDRVRDPALVVAADGRVQYANGAYTRLTDSQGTWPSFGETAGQDAETIRELLAAADSGNGPVPQRRLLRAGGVHVPVEVEINALAAGKAEDQGCYAVVCRDLSGQDAYEARIDYLACHDRLTGLGNRVLIQRRIECIRADPARADERVALLLMDLDGFKAVNDSLGHAGGDALLRGVAERLKAAVPGSATVARLGGDEFAILLESIGETTEAAAFAGAIRDALKAPLDVDGHTVFATASIGVSCYPDDGRALDRVLHAADRAMYRAKQLGHDRFEYYRPEADADPHRLLRLRSNLHRALERDEFRVHYQPLVDLASGRVTGVEALLRWQNSELGLVSPGEFIPIAEHTGLIVPIGEWVLRTACRELKALHKAGHAGLRVAVNLSALQFRQTDLAERVAGILDEVGLPGHCLELEITESVLMEQADASVDMLHRLARLDVSIALDDFGTGYSSLSYLKHFPINYLKVDKTFVDGIPAEEDDVVITRTVIAMARSLRIRLTAEGVETEAQRRWLRERRCEEAQGYLFSMPLAPDDLRWLLDRYPVLPVTNVAAHV